MTETIEGATAHRITNEAVLAAAKAVSLDWQNFVPSMRAALEAALPYLPTQPVASQERVAEVLRTHEFKAVGGPGQEVFICYCGFVFEEPGTDGYYGGPFSLHLADALLAAGVFREDTD